MECGICLELYDTGVHAPMVSTSCGHSVCASCSHSLILPTSGSNSNSTASVRPVPQCPICRTPLQSFVKNFDALTLLSAQSTQTQKDSGQQQHYPARNTRNLETLPFEIEFSRLRFQTRSETQLGSGAFGTVYLGYLDGHAVALKLVRNFGLNSSQTQIAQQQLSREIYQYSKLHSPHLVQFLGTSRNVHDNNAERNLIIVTELMNGGSLRNALAGFEASKSVLPALLILRISAQIARALAYLHENNYSHGDIKSSNILLAEPLMPETPANANVCAKLGDFGLLKDLAKLSPQSSTAPSSSAGSSDAVGTWAYLCPEGFENRSETGEGSKQSDVYSFGVLMWELITCVEPWKGVGLPELFVKVGVRGQRPGNPHAASGLIQHLPPGFAHLIDICWQQLPSNRPSIQLLTTHLESMLERMLISLQNTQTPSVPAGRNPAASMPARQPSPQYILVGDQRHHSQNAMQTTQYSSDPTRLSMHSERNLASSSSSVPALRRNESEVINIRRSPSSSTAPSSRSALNRNSSVSIPRTSSVTDSTSQSQSSPVTIDFEKQLLSDLKQGTADWNLILKAMVSTRRTLREHTMTIILNELSQHLKLQGNRNDDRIIRKFAEFILKKQLLAILIDYVIPRYIKSDTVVAAGLFCGIRLLEYPIPIEDKCKVTEPRFQTLILVLTQHLNAEPIQSGCLQLIRCLLIDQLDLENTHDTLTMFENMIEPSLQAMTKFRDSQRVNEEALNVIKVALCATDLHTDSKYKVILTSNTFRKTATDKLISCKGIPSLTFASRYAFFSSYLCLCCCLVARPESALPIATAGGITIVISGLFNTSLGIDSHCLGLDALKALIVAGDALSRRVIEERGIQVLSKDLDVASREPNGFEPRLRACRALAALAAGGSFQRRTISDTGDIIAKLLKVIQAKTTNLKELDGACDVLRYLSYDTQSRAKLQKMKTDKAVKSMIRKNGPMDPNLTFKVDEIIANLSKV